MNKALDKGTFDSINIKRLFCDELEMQNSVFHIVKQSCFSFVSIFFAISIIFFIRVFTSRLVSTTDQESKSFREVIKADVGALEGIGEKLTEMLNALHVKTVEDLANWKVKFYFIFLKFLKFLFLF